MMSAYFGCALAICLYQNFDRSMEKNDRLIEKVLDAVAFFAFLWYKLSSLK